jgi:hypothetical protein
MDVLWVSKPTYRPAFRYRRRWVDKPPQVAIEWIKYYNLYRLDTMDNLKNSLTQRRSGVRVFF